MGAQELGAQNTAKVAAFRWFAWGVLGYNILVVLWGAFVRATGSGAGCGNAWPLCNGEVVPRSATAEMAIEFTHRITSGLALLAVAALLIWALRLFPRGHRVRFLAKLSLAFILVEAALGAGLVLFEYVAQNESIGRAFYLSAHLANTQILLAMLTLTAWLAGRPADASYSGGPGSKFIFAALPVALAVGVTGAIAALGDTLYPAESLSHGIQREFTAGAPALLRLRLMHPAVSVAGASFLFFVAIRVRRTVRSGAVRTTAAIAVGLLAIQLAAGLINVVLLAPVWMQIIHLLLADLLWISLVVLIAQSREKTAGEFEKAVAC